MALPDTPFSCMSVREVRTGLLAREFSAQEIVQDCLARIRSLDGATHAFLETCEQLATSQAACIDKAISKDDLASVGPLAGVPVALKDNINLKGTHTTCASRMLASYVSPYTATCAQRILDAGGIVVGKLNMDEFAFGSSTQTSAYGPTKNPWDLTRVPGGSSGGSAAAVSAGLATLALGSDTGGSIRQPGSFCGVLALKPTYGMVSRYGVCAFGSSLDQVGPLARSVEDVAYCLNAIAGRDVLDCTSQDVACDFTANLAEGISGMKIGVVVDFMEADGISAEVKEKIEQVAGHLRTLGATLQEIDLPHARAAVHAYHIFGPCEAFSNLARFDSIRYGYCEPNQKTMTDQYSTSRARGFGVEAYRRIMLGSYLLSAGVYNTYYYPAQQVRTLVTQDYQRAFECVDCILAPTAPSAAFPLEHTPSLWQTFISDMLTVSINIAGNGGMSMPVGLGKDTNLPLGAQLICPAFKDEDMLRVAAALESVYGQAPVAPNFAPGSEIPKDAQADIPDAMKAVAGVELPGLIDAVAQGKAGK